MRVIEDSSRERLSFIVLNNIVKKKEVLYNLYNGAPEEIRTPDPQIRSLVLYPAELRVHNIFNFYIVKTKGS